jgi:hypothetical protein
MRNSKKIKLLEWDCNVIIIIKVENIVFCWYYFFLSMDLEVEIIY